MPLSSSLATELTTTQPATANNEMQVDIIRPKASASFSTDTPIESASGAASKNVDEQLQWKPNSREWLTLLCLGIVSMVVALDTNILVPVLPAIARGLSGNATDTFWAGTSYLLTCAVFQPFIVSLSDIFGRRQLLFSSVSFFTVGTIICCVAQNFGQLFAGRSIQGIGGGGITALGLVIITDIVPLRSRPTYYGLIQIAWAVGTMMGPLAGGLFAEHANWRWVFYINFPFCAIGLGLVPIAVRLRAKRGTLKHRLLHTVDWVGAILFIASISSFLIGTSWGGQMYPWSSWNTYVPISLGVAGVVGTLMWERYGAETPFIRLWLFNKRSAVAAYACAILQGLLMFCKLYSIALYLQACRGLTPTITGVGILGLNFGLLTVSVVSGRLITRSGQYRWAIWSGWAIIIASTATMITLDASTPTYGWVLLFIPLGIGHGLVLISLNFSIQALAKERDGAYAAGMYTFARTFGMCLGVAVAGTLLHNTLLQHLRDAHLDEGIAHSAEAFIFTLNALNQHVPRESEIRTAYAGAFRNIFEVLTGVAVLGGLLSLLIEQVTLDRALESEHVFDAKVVKTSAV